MLVNDEHLTKVYDDWMPHIWRLSLLILVCITGRLANQGREGGFCSSFPGGIRGAGGTRAALLGRAWRTFGRARLSGVGQSAVIQ